MHKHLANDVYRMKNNNPYLGGIPDVWYSGNFQSLWVEYKYVPVAKPTFPVVPALSAQQLHWILERKKEGRNVWVIVGCKSGGIIFKCEKHILRGMSVLSFKSYKEIATEIHSFCHKEPSNATTKCSP